MKIFYDRSELRGDHFIVTYDVKSSVSLKDVAWQIALGQSIGNPNMRSKWETKELIDDFACKILTPFDETAKEGIIKLAFPHRIWNPDSDGISQLLCIILGGQVDIDSILKCRVLDIKFDNTSWFLRPAMGLSGFRHFTNQYNKPLFGGIIKPKTGINPNTLLDMTMELVEGGVDFIKEDEILGNPHICDFSTRVHKIAKYIKDTKTVFCFAINGDARSVLAKAKEVAKLNIPNLGVHINVWSGLGTYRSVRELYPNLFIHFQKSGDLVFTDPDNKYSFAWSVICKIAAWSGIDTIHAGMLGGYHNDDKDELLKIMEILTAFNVVPALSCGLTAQNVGTITAIAGNDYLANSGGAIHSHENGTTAGAKSIRAAIDSRAGISEWLR